MAGEDVSTVGTQPAETQAPADVTTKIETPTEQVADQSTAEAKPAETQEAPPTDEGEQEDKPKKPSGSERLKRRLALIQADADALARENEELRRRSIAGDPQQGKPGIDRPPTEADFPNDYLAFERASNAWNVRQAVREEISTRDKASRETQLREIRQERIEAYEEGKSLARERIPDFDKVLASAQSVNVSPNLADEILSSEKAALLQYHLAQKPDLVRELNGLSGRELAREIGRLEARIHLPTAKKATEASAPPSQVRGAAAPPVDAQAGPDDMNAYVAWRRKQAKA
jgi:hypothetical protein